MSTETLCFCKDSQRLGKAHASRHIETKHFCGYQQCRLEIVKSYPPRTVWRIDGDADLWDVMGAIVTKHPAPHLDPCLDLRLCQSVGGPCRCEGYRSRWEGAGCRSSVGDELHG
jgi:hypothetical protein